MALKCEHRQQHPLSCRKNMWPIKTSVQLIPSGSLAELLDVAGREETEGDWLTQVHLKNGH